MLGPEKSRDLDRPVLVSLEALVPKDHFYRHLERRLDLSFVREVVRDRYAPTGRPSVDPVVFFKLQLIMFFEGIRSGAGTVAQRRRLHLGVPPERPGGCVGDTTLRCPSTAWRDHERKSAPGAPHARAVRDHARDGTLRKGG